MWHCVRKRFEVQAPFMAQPLPKLITFYASS